MLVRGTHVARGSAWAQAPHPWKEVFLKFAIDLGASGLAFHTSHRLEII